MGGDPQEACGAAADGLKLLKLFMQLREKADRDKAIRILEKLVARRKKSVTAAQSKDS